MKKSYLSLILGFIIAIAGCKTSNEASSQDLRLVVEGNTQFALELYSQLRETDGNLFFSPYSISTALSMTYAGAKGNTALEMEKTLHFTMTQEGTQPSFHSLKSKFEKTPKGGKFQLYIANSIFPQVDHSFLPEYTDLLKKYYGITVTPVNYASAAEGARQLINRWVEDQTRSKIKDLIMEGDLDKNTLLTLVNAIYFKGNWLTRFDPDLTGEKDFIMLSGDKARVPMMMQSGKFKYKELDNAQVLELPYDGEHASMFIVLPREADGIVELENSLTTKNLREWFSGLTLEELVLYLPRFEITWGTIDLKQPLLDLGMIDAFAPGEADFSGMDGTKDLFISLVLHNAFIEVNEEGTEAAAATAVVMTKGPGPKTFRADHPFIFMIKENTTGSILFLGRLMEPG
ncbi:serpin family protein [bacterium]|nr:serpin family protein [bacterium]